MRKYSLSFQQNARHFYEKKTLSSLANEAFLFYTFYKCTILISSCMWFQYAYLLNFIIAVSNEQNLNWFPFITLHTELDYAIWNFQCRNYLKNLVRLFYFIEIIFCSKFRLINFLSVALSNTHNTRFVTDYILSCTINDKCAC